jgi:hypothetical protein
MSSTQGYEKLSIDETGTGDGLPTDMTLIEEAQYDAQLDRVIAIRNDRPFPISRPPPKARDWGYAVMFLLHFGGILLLSLIEQQSLHHSLINYSRASSWSSMVMIITLVGSSLGAALSFLLGWPNIRDTLLGSGVTFSLVLKICLGNTLLIMRSTYSFLGVLVILSAVVDSFWSKSAKEGVNFSSELLQTVIDTTKLYGISLVVTCAAIVAAQTGVLLWWGSFFIGLVSTVSAKYAILFIIPMALSLYWITQFFHALLSFIVGGCVLWIFVKPETDKAHPSQKLLLYVQCALTTSLGSICKGALTSTASQNVLDLNHWINRRPQSLARNCCSLRGVAARVLSHSTIEYAERHHRLTFCLTALYGRAFCSTAHSLLSAHRETLDICIEDSTHFLLSNVAVALAACVAILFVLIAERGEGSVWALFFFVSYYLAYCGVSLCVHVYSSAVDALMVAAAISPAKFAHENQIVYLRFLRTSEQELR